MLRTVRSLIHEAVIRLVNSSESARLDGEVLLAAVSRQPRTWLLAHPEASVSDAEYAAFDAALRRLETGEPLPYVVGYQEFYGLTFRVTPAALIPRPETELMVERALQWLESAPPRRLAADVGCGSGCIAVTLANHQPDLHILATDSSYAALRVARENAQRLGAADRIDFCQMDLLSSTTAKFDLICANLPYIPRPRLEVLRVARWEPLQALDGGPDGLEHVRRLLYQAEKRLKDGGRVLLEIDCSHSRQAKDLAKQALPGARLEIAADLAGLDRLLIIDRPGREDAENRG